MVKWPFWNDFFNRKLWNNYSSCIDCLLCHVARCTPSYGLNHNPPTSESCDSLWVMRLTVRRLTLYESYYSLWVVWLTVSHTTHCESYDSLWVILHSVSRMTRCESCNSLWDFDSLWVVHDSQWVKRLTVSHATHCESYGSLWVVKLIMSRVTYYESHDSLWGSCSSFWVSVTHYGIVYKNTVSRISVAEGMPSTLCVA